MKCPLSYDAVVIGGKTTTATTDIVNGITFSISGASTSDAYATIIILPDDVTNTEIGETYLDIKAYYTDDSATDIEAHQLVKLTIWPDCSLASMQAVSSPVPFSTEAYTINDAKKEHDMDSALEASLWGCDVQYPMIEWVYG